MHFSKPAERPQRTPEEEEEDDDDEDEESGSSSASSIGGSVAIVESGESKPDDQSRAMSYYFDCIEHEGAESGDEDGFVHVSRCLRRGGSRGSPHCRQD